MSPAQLNGARSGRRRIIVIGALVIAAIIGFLLIKDSLFAPEPVKMMTARVTRGTVEETVLATGTLKPAKLVAVGAQVSGRITAIKVKLGETIRQGDLVAEIDSVTQQNALRTAEASLAAVHAQKAEKEASLVLAQQTLARQKKLVAQTAVSQADFESAEAEVATARAQIAALEAQIAEAEVGVDTARVNLGYTRITAPMDGTVLYIVSQEGQTVNAAQTAPTIIILGDLQTMMVRAEISEADVVNVKAGQKLFFNIIGEPDRRYEATLEFIEPAPESITSDSAVSTSSTSSTSKSSSSSSSSSTAIYYNGIFYVPNPEGRLRTYMTAEVHIILGRAADVLTIPSIALGPRQRDGSHTVQVLEADGQVTSRAVEVGLNNKTRAEIKSGLKEGETVVTGQLSGTGAPNATRRMPPPPMGL
ncbi:efflux RND transporter periplasmic adaptor subunit [Xanthobacter variabilis]|uniref:efflux RND transporter periplasmic adaptor subunit n=1 Tax=Xanthobacter variabilis TaxID=3119932 RepID=UPI003729D6BD